MADLLERLSRTTFFADASPAALARVGAASRARTLVRGDVLFNEGDPPDALYLVNRGRIAIAMSNPIDHRESVVALMEPGDLFGEMGMLDNGPRSAMARALEPSELIEVPFEPVREADMPAVLVAHLARLQGLIAAERGDLDVAERRLREANGVQVGDRPGHLEDPVISARR